MLGYRENLAFTMATLVVSVTLVPAVLLSIDIGLDIEQVDWVPSFQYLSCENVSFKMVIVNVTHLRRLSLR